MEVKMALEVEDMEFQPSEQELKQLKEWIAKSPHIVQDYDDTILSAFVRGCKGRLQKTKKILEGFNSLGQLYPNVMKNYDPFDERLVENLSQALTFTLPKKTRDDPIVYMSVVKNYEGFKSEPYKSHSTDFFRYWILSLYVYLWKNDFGSGKCIIIGDCKNTSLAHLREFTPTLITQILQIMQNALPVRVEAVHLLNVPSYMEYICNLIKSLATKKMSERIYFHSTMETFYDKFPKEILPKEYGGNEGSVFTLHDRWYATVKSFRKEFLEEEAKMRRLDPLRPKNDVTEEMVGTFKTLNVD